MWALLIDFQRFRLTYKILYSYVLLLFIAHITWYGLYLIDGAYLVKQQLFVHTYNIFSKLFDIVEILNNTPCKFLAICCCMFSIKIRGKFSSHNEDWDWEASFHEKRIANVLLSCNDFFFQPILYISFFFFSPIPCAGYRHY